jgi:FMN phosphatase YigB (HAD superfamily)
MLNDQLKALIDDADIVSFDVFDTLLLRRHYSPADVFTHAGGAQSKWFRLMRIAAEQVARIRHRPQQDVTLEQIYAVWRRSPERELRAEEQTLFANPGARAIYDYAVASGKTVIAVSDMYLPQLFLKRAIERAGYGELHKVYVSCEAGFTKITGDLFHHVAEDMGVAPARIVHIGDNEQTDVIRARERGLQAWYLPSPRVRFEAENPVHPEIARYLRRGAQPVHSLLLGILRDGLSDPSPAHDYWYRLGFSVAGPIVNAFADWIHDRFNHGRHSGVFLFAPLPQQVLALRYPRVPTHYTFASRRLFLADALEHPTETNITREAQALRAYLTSIDMLSSNVRPLVVDLGWTASSQRFLEMAVPELTGTSGAYFGLSDDAYRNGNMSGWFFDGFKHLRARRIATGCTEIMELLFSAPHPSIRRVDALPDGTFAPVYEPAEADEERKIAIVRKINEGALDFTRSLAGHESAGYPIRISRDDVAHFIHALVLRPTPEDIRHLGALPHAVGLGTSQSPVRPSWPGGLTRAIFQHGRAREVASRIIFATARLILAGRERVAQLLGK